MSDSVHIITKLIISITYYHKFNVLSELFCWKSAGDRNHKQSLTRMAAHFVVLLPTLIFFFTLKKFSQSVAPARSIRARNNLPQTTRPTFYETLNYYLSIFSASLLCGSNGLSVSWTFKVLHFYISCYAFSLFCRSHGLSICCEDPKHPVIVQ